MFTSLANIYTHKVIQLVHALKLSSSKRDALIVLLGVGTVYLCALTFNLSETLHEWSSEYEDWQLDEIPFALFAFAVLSAWFSQRRLLESYKQFELRKEMGKALIKSQLLYKKIFDESLTGNCVMDTHGNIEMFNSNFVTICGDKYPAMNAKYLFDFSWQEMLSELEHIQELNFTKLKINRSDKLICFVVARLIYIASESETSKSNAKIHVYFADITEQCLAESDLEKTLNENRQLALHAMKAQENERKYIAREIHDETGQFLSAIRMDALAIKNLPKAQVAAIANRIEANAKHIQKSVRALIKHLRPPILDTNGLIGAIEHMVSDWKEMNPNAYYELVINLNSEDVSEEINTIAYRIVQEALTNIHRHAQAKWVKIKLFIDADRAERFLCIEIRDDGIGFDPSTLQSGIGLVGMRERVDSVQGEFKILSAKGAGSFISANLPIKTNLTPSSSNSLQPLLGTLA